MVFIISFWLLFFINSAFSQTDLKNWNSIQLDLSLSKKTSLRLSHLRGYNITNNYDNEFNQTSARIDYDVTKQFSLAAGVTINGSLLSDEGASRIMARTTYKFPVADYLSWSNSLQGEVHSSKETRYRYRMIYITRLGTKNRFKFLRLSPSVSYWLFYNIGGDKIQYFDKSGDPIAFETPDGFHRGRLFVNLNSKINKYLSVSLYYMMQREFNLFSSEFHKINIINPNDELIIRPFNDYNVLGTTVSIDFDLYKKKKKKPKKESKNRDN